MGKVEIWVAMPALSSVRISWTRGLDAEVGIMALGRVRVGLEHPTGVSGEKKLRRTLASPPESWAAVGEAAARRAEHTGLPDSAASKPPPREHFSNRRVGGGSGKSSATMPLYAQPRRPDHHRPHGRHEGPGRRARQRAAHGEGRPQEQGDRQEGARSTTPRRPGSCRASSSSARTRSSSSRRPVARSSWTRRRRRSRCCEAYLPAGGERGRRRGGGGAGGGRDGRRLGQGHGQGHEGGPGGPRGGRQAGRRQEGQRGGAQAARGG